MNWIMLNQIENISELENASQQTPVLLYKHSYRCSIATVAFNRIEKHEALSGLQGFFVDVVKHRDVSLALAEKYGVEHASPQSIVIFRGKSIHDSSHLAIFPQDIHEVLTQNQIA